MLRRRPLSFGASKHSHYNSTMGLSKEKDAGLDSFRSGAVSYTARFHQPIAISVPMMWESDCQGIALIGVERFVLCNGSLMYAQD